MKKVTKKQLWDTFRSLVPEKDIRPQQAEVIRHILAGRDVLAIIPTGGGKSACYQVPAMHLPGITLVVSPLKALMEDQVGALEQAGFPAACLSFDVIINKGNIYRRRDDDGKAAPRNEAGSMRISTGTGRPATNITSSCTSPPSGCWTSASSALPGGWRSA